MEKKKNDKYDLHRKSPLFFSIGLIIAMLCVTVAFEWRSEYDKLEISEPKDIFEPMIDIPITNYPKPKPPKAEKKIELVKPKQIRNIIVADDVSEITEVLKEDAAEVDIEDIPMIDLPVEKVEETVDFAEVMPEFPGGIRAFYKYVADNLEYPSQARRMGVEGKVFLQFVIDKDGKVIDVKVLRGIGFGCDEEAVRVLENAPTFKPGRQGAYRVKVRQALPINFKLAN